VQEGVKRLTAWINTTTNNLKTDDERRKQHVVVSLDQPIEGREGTTLGDNLIDLCPSIEEEVSGRVILGQIMEVVNDGTTLTPYERFVLVQYYLNDLTDPEIVVLFRKSPELVQKYGLKKPSNGLAIKRTRHRALEKIRKHLGV